MKKIKPTKKLALNKEKVAILNDTVSSKINGGNDYSRVSCGVCDTDENCVVKKHKDTIK